MNFLAMHNLNEFLFQFINNAVGYYPTLDTLFIGTTSYMALAGVAVVLGGYYFVYAPYKAVGLDRLRAFARAGGMASSLVLTWGIVHLIKLGVALPRPFVTLRDVQVIITHPQSYSFPSGHAAMAFAFATVVYAHNKRLGMLLYFFAFLVGFSRMYVGVHYPIDVIAGALIGYVIPKLFQMAFPPVKVPLHENQKTAS
jgi:undecaprenyl-diphosphatase